MCLTLLIVVRRCRPSRRGVDRNLIQLAGCLVDAGRPSRRGVDRNTPETIHHVQQPQSPLTQGRGSKPLQAPAAYRTKSSPLTQGRGSKHRVPWLQQSGLAVAPHAGAWIETSDVQPAGGCNQSPLTQGRGSKRSRLRTSRRRRPSPLTQGRGSKLFVDPEPKQMPPSPLTQGRGSKRGDLAARLCAEHVAPHAGAWIETHCASVSMRAICVAPHAGAWIETAVLMRPALFVASPLTQGRGSKRAQPPEPQRHSRRPSRRGVDRNLLDQEPDNLVQGRPSRRGVDRNPMSNPAIGRPGCRPSRRGVDRNRRKADGNHDAERRPSRRGVDRNQRGRDEMQLRGGRPSRRGVDRNVGAFKVAESVVGSPLTQGRGSKRARRAPRHSRVGVAPHAGAWIETARQCPHKHCCTCRPSRRGVDRNCRPVTPTSLT